MTVTREELAHNLNRHPSGLDREGLPAESRPWTRFNGLYIPLNPPTIVTPAESIPIVASLTFGADERRRLAYEFSVALPQENYSRSRISGARKEARWQIATRRALLLDSLYQAEAEEYDPEFTKHTLLGLHHTHFASRSVVETLQATFPAIENYRPSSERLLRHLAHVPTARTKALEDLETHLVIELSTSNSKVIQLSGLPLRQLQE